jgi:hypothetical protein
LTEPDPLEVDDLWSYLTDLLHRLDDLEERIKLMELLVQETQQD